MLNNILVLIGMFVAGAIFTYLRPKIFKRAKTTVKDKLGLNASIGNVYKKNGEEAFQIKKFVRGFGGLLSPVGWAKDFIGLFNSRKLVIYILIISCIFAYGYWKGNQNTPIKVDIGYGKSAIVKLNGSFLHITETGEVWIEDKDGNKIKRISVKDIPSLKRKLAPIGLQFEPIGILGGGFGAKGISGELGAGVSWLRYWKWRLDSFITNRGIYPLGTSYKITDNSGVGIGVGKGWQGDNRVTVYYRWRF
jgi:hypothetical protein